MGGVGARSRRRHPRKGNITCDGGKVEKMGGARATFEVVEVREFHNYYLPFLLGSKRQHHWVCKISVKTRQG